jgi:hypothetical protein
MNLVRGTSCRMASRMIHWPNQTRVSSSTNKLRLILALTSDFRQTVQARATRDVTFRRALFQEAVQTLLQGNIDAGGAAIRDYINATLGFEKLSAALGRSQKSVMRMFGPGGNPTAENLLGVIGVLQVEASVHLEVRAVADAA